MIRLEILVIYHSISKHADRNRVESCVFGIISYRLGVNSLIVFEKFEMRIIASHVALEIFASA